MGLPGSAVAERVINAKRRSPICARIDATTPNIECGELYVMASDMPIVQAAALVNALFTLLRMRVKKLLSYFLQTELLAELCTSTEYP